MNDDHDMVNIAGRTEGNAQEANQRCKLFAGQTISGFNQVKNQTLKTKIRDRRFGAI